jgi:hypothetical protein
VKTWLGMSVLCWTSCETTVTESQLEAKGVDIALMSSMWPTRRSVQGFTPGHKQGILILHPYYTKGQAQEAHQTVLLPPCGCMPAPVNDRG